MQTTTLTFSSEATNKPEITTVIIQGADMSVEDLCELTRLIHIVREATKYLVKNDKLKHFQEEDQILIQTYYENKFTPEQNTYFVDYFVVLMDEISNGNYKCLCDECMKEENKDS